MWWHIAVTCPSQRTHGAYKPKLWGVHPSSHNIASTCLLPSTTPTLDVPLEPRPLRGLGCRARVELGRQLAGIPGLHEVLKQLVGIVRVQLAA